MKICIIEDNLVGMLSAIYHFYYTYRDIDLITSEKNAYNLTDEFIEIESDVYLAQKVRNGIIKKIGHKGYKQISNAYLSSDKNKEQKIFNYLKKVFEYGCTVCTMYHESDIIAFNDMLRKVMNETHRMTGFIRFQEMDNGIYYSYFGTDNDVIELLIPHFISRFNDQQFVLHDIKRHKMAYYNGKRCFTMLAPKSINISLSEREMIVKNLWRQYNCNVTISDRKNEKLQNHYAPKKYRWFMNEF